MIRYDEHADFQLARRGIDKKWVEETILHPDATETAGSRKSYFKCLPDRHVVTPVNDSELVIITYFDRAKPCT
jgi:hypothetical protein